MFCYYEFFSFSDLDRLFEWYAPSDHNTCITFELNHLKIINHDRAIIHVVIFYDYNNN